MGDVVNLNVKRRRVPSEVSDKYVIEIAQLDKLELLEEMLHFQEERKQVGFLTPEMMVLGQILYQAIADSAETPELRNLTQSYTRHLKYEYEAYLKGDSDDQVR